MDYLEVLCGFYKDVNFRIVKKCCATCRNLELIFDEGRSQKRCKLAFEKYNVVCSTENVVCNNWEK